MSLKVAIFKLILYLLIGSSCCSLISAQSTMDPITESQVQAHIKVHNNTDLTFR